MLHRRSLCVFGLVCLVAACQGGAPTKAGGKVAVRATPRATPRPTPKATPTPPPAVAAKAAVPDLTGVVRAPAGLIAANGAKVVSNNGSNLVSDGGGNLVSDKGGSALGGAGRAWRLLAVAEQPLAGTRVLLVDGAGAPIPGVAPVATDAQGRYAFKDVPRGLRCVVRAEATTAAGKPATLDAVADTTLPLPVDVSTAMAITSITLVDRAGGQLDGLYLAGLASLVAALAAAITPADLPDFADRAAVAAAFDALLARSPELTAAKAAYDAAARAEVTTGIQDGIAETRERLEAMRAELEARQAGASAEPAAPADEPAEEEAAPP